jgi:hypothetical protein
VVRSNWLTGVSRTFTAIAETQREPVPRVDTGEQGLTEEQLRRPMPSAGTSPLERRAVAAAGDPAGSSPA